MIYEIDGLKIYEHGEPTAGVEIDNIIEYPPGVLLRVTEVRPHETKGNCIINTLGKNAQELTDEILDDRKGLPESIWRPLLKYFNEHWEPTVEELDI